MATWPEFWQYCRNAGDIAGNVCSSSYLDGFGNIVAILPERIIPAILQETNLHTKSNIAAILPECIAVILLQYCHKTLPQVLYFGKGIIVD